MRDIAHLLLAKTELLAAGESSKDHQEWQEQERQRVDLDRSSPRGLFSGAFYRSRPSVSIHDRQDGVVRCPTCTWELEAGECGQCGWREFSDNESVSVSEASFSTIDENTTDLGEDGGILGFDEAGAYLDAELHDFPFDSPRQFGFSDMDSFHDDEADDEDDDSVGSLDDFIVGDDHSYTGGTHPFSYTSNDEASGTESTVSIHGSTQSLDDESESSGSLQDIIARAHQSRNVVDVNEQRDSEPVAAAPNSIGNSNTSGSPRRRPRSSRPNRETVVISSSESDSSMPVISHRSRRRPRIRHQMSPDEEEEPRFVGPGSNGDNSNARSTSAATVGRHSPTSRRNGHSNATRTQSSTTRPFRQTDIHDSANDSHSRFRERSIPGAYPPSSFRSEPSQAAMQPNAGDSNSRPSIRLRHPQSSQVYHPTEQPPPPRPIVMIPHRNPASPSRTRKAERKRQRREQQRIQANQSGSVEA